MKKVGRKIVGMEYRVDNNALSRLDFSLVDSPYAFSVGLPQTETERILAAPRPGDLGDCVTAILVAADGSTQVVRAAWVIGADWAHCRARSGSPDTHRHPDRVAR